MKNVQIAHMKIMKTYGTAGLFTVMTIAEFWFHLARGNRINLPVHRQSNQLRINFKSIFGWSASLLQYETITVHSTFLTPNQLRINSESTPNQLRIDFLFVNRINSESNANRVLFRESNQLRINSESIFFFLNRINSESNANRVFFCESNQLRIKYESSFVLWIEPTLHQMRIEFCFVNRINSESTPNRMRIEPTPNQMRIEFLFDSVPISNQLISRKKLLYNNPRP